MTVVNLAANHCPYRCNKELFASLCIRALSNLKDQICNKNSLNMFDRL